MLLTATLAWGVLAFGGVYRWAYMPLLVMAAVTGVAAWLAARRARVPARILVCAALTVLAIASQLIPLPRSTISWLSPAAHRILSETNLAYAAGAVRHPLSVSPAMTTIAVVFLITITVFVAGVASWLTRERLRFTAGLIVIIGVVIAVEGVVQRVLSPTLIYGQPALIYGFWKPVSGRDPFGPFVNKNHFAGWMLMAIPVALGLAVGLAVRYGIDRRRDWRSLVLRFADPTVSRSLLTAFCALIMLVALFSTLSRSGIAAAFVTLAIGAIVLGHRARAGVVRYLTAGVIAATLVAALWAGVDALASRFAALDSSVYGARLALWQDATRITADSPITGIGLRAYSTASLIYQTALPELHVGAAHNDWLQIAAEGGILVGVPALMLLAVLLREAYVRFAEHRRRSEFGTTYWIRAGAAIGLAAIGLQSFVEFSLQMPGNAVMFAVLWAMVITPAPPEHSVPGE